MNRDEQENEWSEVETVPTPGQPAQEGGDETKLEFANKKFDLFQPGKKGTKLNWSQCK